MAASDYLEQKILETVLNNAAFPTIANSYISLHTADVLDDGSGAEVADANNYARVELGSFTSMTGITDGQTENVAEIPFPQATGGAWGVVIAIGIWDSGVHGSGNLLYWGGLTIDKQVDENDTFKIAAGDLIVTVS